MKRKIVLSIAALLIVFDIGFTAAAINSGERRATAAREGAAAIGALVRNYIRPIPKLDGFQ